MEEKIVNRVEASGLITINLEDFYVPGERLVMDMKDLLFQGLILKEKDFREYLKNENWEQYRDKLIAITCSNEAIVPTWAYMLLGIYLAPVAKKVVFGDLNALETLLFQEQLDKLKTEQYQGARVVIKGCGELPVPVNAFLDLANRLRPYVKSLMYGEPCSTVPLYKSTIKSV